MDLVARLIEAVPGGVVHVGPDGSIVAANREALRILGYRFDELTQRYIVDFGPETLFEDGSPCPAAEYPVALVLATGRPQGPTTIGIKKPDGAVSWAVFRAEPIEEEGRLVGVIVTFLDITARKQSEAALRLSEERWRGLSEHSPDFVITVDRDIRILAINRVLPDFVLDQVIGQCSLMFIDPNFVEDWRRRFDNAVATRSPVRFETRGLGMDEAYHWYDTSLVPVVENDEVVRVLVVARDVTERRTMLTSLAEKDRLASVGMLASSVAHEVMNPLTSVLANLEVARREGGERREAAIADAHEAASRMQQVVWDLRSLARTGTEELFYVDVRTVLETALRLCGPEISRTSNVVLELSEVPGVLASESRLCQVFINLFVNAAQAARGDANEIRVRTLLAGSDVGVEFTDGGEGIAEESIARVFEPFYTTKQSGTGLGLSICRDIVERMGGRIDVASTRGVGSCFTVWLSTTRPPAKGAGGTSDQNRELGAAGEGSKSESGLTSLTAASRA